MNVVAKTTSDLANGTYWTTMSMPGKSGQATFDLKALTARSSVTGDRVPVLSSQIAFGDSLSFSLEGKANARGVYIPTDEASALKVGTLSWWFGAGNFPTKYTVTLYDTAPTGETVTYTNSMGDPITSLDGVEGKTVEINTHIDGDKIVESLTDQNDNKFDPVSENKFMITVGESLLLTPKVKPTNGYAVFVENNKTTTLTWNELKDPANGEKFGYNAEKITDNEVQSGAFERTVRHGDECEGWDEYFYCSSLVELNLPKSITKVYLQSTTDTTDSINGSTWNLATVSINSDCERVNTSKCTNMYINCDCETVYANCKNLYISDNISYENDEQYWNFTNCETVKLGNNMKRTPIFSDSTLLASIELPSSLTKISSFSFSNTGLTSVDLPQGLKIIGNCAFSGCNISTITIPDGIEYLSGFDDTKLTSINIPDSVQILGSYAFDNCPIAEHTNLVLPNSLKEIHCQALRFSTDIDSIYIPDNVTIIEAGGGGGYYEDSNGSVKAKVINCQPSSKPSGWVYEDRGEGCGYAYLRWYEMGSEVHWGIEPPVNN